MSNAVPTVLPFLIDPIGAGGAAAGIPGFNKYTPGGIVGSKLNPPRPTIKQPQPGPAPKRRTLPAVRLPTPRMPTPPPPPPPPAPVAAPMAPAARPLRDPRAGSGDVGDRTKGLIGGGRGRGGLLQ